MADNSPAARLARLKASGGSSRAIANIENPPVPDSSWIGDFSKKKEPSRDSSWIGDFSKKKPPTGQPAGQTQTETGPDTTAGQTAFDQQWS